MLSVCETKQLNAGEVLAGKYRVVRELGVGGFGRVYAAHNIDLELPVAIKVRRIRGPNQRLRREAQLGARLRSPFSVQVFDVDQLDDGTPFIVMELLHGQSLSEYLKIKGRVDPELARHWLLQLCAVLGEAHGLKQIHRDIKPSNLFLVDHPHLIPQIKLLDFGLAKGLDKATDVTVTESGVVVGSPAYMSPEQLRGAPLTAQSDIWAVGVLLYEMLSGLRPFSGGSNAAVLAAIAADPAPPLHEALPDAPAVFDAIIARCLRKRASERYSSSAELAEALSGLAPPSVQTQSSISGGLSITDSRREAAPPSTRRFKPVLWLASGVALVLAAGAGSANGRWTPPRESASALGRPPANPAAPAVTAQKVERLAAATELGAQAPPEQKAPTVTSAHETARTPDTRRRKPTATPIPSDSARGVGEVAAPASVGTEIPAAVPQRASTTGSSGSLVLFEDPEF